MLNAEVWLAVGILGFYIFDCLRLTEPNSVYFTYAFSHWDYRMPSHTLRIGRRSLDLFNPVKPWQLQVPSSLMSKPCKAKQRIDKKFTMAVHGLVPLQIVLSLCLLIGLPAVLVLYGLGQIFLLLFAVVYACIGMSLFKVFRQRKALHLSVVQCVSLAVECLLCSPFAANLVRKIGLLQADAPDAAAFARMHFNSETLGLWRDRLGIYVHEQQQWYSAEEPMHQEWQAIGKRIQGGKA